MKNNPAKFRFTSRGVNEARGGLILLATGPVRSKKKVGKKKARKNPAAPETHHHEIRSSPTTATTSRRRAMKHVPRVSLRSPASIVLGVCLNRPRTALASSKNDELYTHRQTK